MQPILLAYFLMIELTVKAGSVQIILYSMLQQFSLLFREE